MGSDIDIQKIYHRPITNPINQITQGTATNTGQTDFIPGVLTTQFPLHEDNNNQGNQTNTNKKEVSPPGRVTGKHAKSSAGIS